MLSPYITPENLNGALVSTSKVGEYLYGSEEYDALDKRNLTIYGQASNYLSSLKSISDTIENTAGIRSPIYKIGEVPQDESWLESKWLPNEVTGLLRAVSRTMNLFGESDNFQRGVIIDGIGDADGEFSVGFTTNPVLFRANSIIDNRFRNPAKLSMTVMVSNYLNDNAAGTLVDSVSSLAPTDFFNEIKNNLAYEGNTRSQYALYQLRWLMENGKPFMVYTPHGVYDNMLIKSIKPTTDSNKMDMLYCTVEFQEVILYSPLSGGVGSQPTRLGVSQPRAGLTELAIKKIDSWFK